MMPHTLSHKVKEKEPEQAEVSQRPIAYHDSHDKQISGIHKEFMTPPESNPKASPMTQISRHMDSTPFVPHCLPGDGGKPEGRNDYGYISPFPNFSSARSREPKVALIREEFVELTEDPLITAVLNRWVHWSEKIMDFNLFWEEEISSDAAKNHSLKEKSAGLNCPIQGEGDLYENKEKSGWRGMDAFLSSSPLRNNTCENTKQRSFND